MAGVVLMDCDQVRNAVAFNVLGTDGMTGAFGRDHDNVDVCGGNDLFEVDVEAVGESEGLAFGQVGSDLGFVNIGLLLVGDQDHDDVCSLGSFCNGHNGQTGFFRLLSGLGAAIQADNNVNAGIAQVQRMSMALRAVADDCNFFAVEGMDVAVLLIVDFNCHGNLPPSMYG